MTNELTKELIEELKAKGKWIKCPPFTPYIEEQTVFTKAQYIGNWQNESLPLQESKRSKKTIGIIKKRASKPWGKI